MVSSSVSFLTKTSRHILLPMGPPDTIPSDQEEFDFSDVFGPAPSQTLIDVDLLSTDNSVPQSASDSKFHVAPLVIHNRSHSLVGPSPRITQFSQLAKLTIHETESSLEIVECSLDEIELHHDKSSTGGPEKNDITVEEFPSVRLEDFDVLKVVGQGAFGKVFQVKRKGTSEIFAMKVMRKDKIMEKNHAEYMKAERDILTKVNHPFIVQLRYSFQNFRKWSWLFSLTLQFAWCATVEDFVISGRKNRIPAIKMFELKGAKTKYRLYLVLEFVNGGHLFFQLYHQGLFREDLACIYTAEIVSAVSHLHANGIMHRDLKPENILLDADGHVMLTDFGLAKEFDENTRSNSMCGTVEYMAPEIILGKGHDQAADWWSVGILVFEMLTGKPPFVGGNNRGRIQQRIVKDKIKLPAFLTCEAHSLLKGLLQKEANKRLGCGPDGSEEIKRHRWFRSINWKKLDSREVQPGFRPNVAGKLCIANFDERWTSMSVLDSPIASPVSGDCDFAGFTFARSPALVQMPSPLQPKSSSST